VVAIFATIEEAKGASMSAAIKCKRCGFMIVRNVRGEWVLPHSVLPSAKCRDGNPHEPDKNPRSDGAGTVLTIAVSTSAFSAGLI